ncbi:hypothetical protein EV121DRAFT_286619 [Schizophyllum commune]
MLNSSGNQSTSRTLRYAVAQSPAPLAQSPTPPASPTKRRPLPSTPPSRPATSRPVSVHVNKLVKREPAALREQRLLTATASTSQRPLSIAMSSGFGHSSELQTLTGPAHSTQLQTHSTHLEARSSAHWSSLPPPPPSTKPLSAEQYWTTRALAGESLHSVHLHYQEKLHQAVAEQEWKREREIATLAEKHKEEQRRKETFLLTLLVGTFITLLMTLHVAGRATQPPPPNKWLSTHFTIPILSPFASVVEHEASIVGTKVLSVCVLVFGAVAYASIRYWLSRPR